MLKLTNQKNEIDIDILTDLYFKQSRVLYNHQFTSYNQFIKESEEVKKDNLIEYWMEKKDLEDLFEPFIDDEYIITYNKTIFKEEPLDLEEDIVNIGDEIYPGWFLKITFDPKLRGREDLTNDFKSIVRELELDGHEITIDDSDGKVNIDKEIGRAHV
jgi:hypothetical protein